VGLLDELKAEAEQARRSQADRRSAEARQKACYEEQLKPALTAVYRYLQELLEQLAAVERDTVTEFLIPGYACVPARQVERKVTIDSIDRLSRVGLRLVYEVDEMRFGVSPLDRAHEARAFFETQRVPFSDWPIRDRDNSIVGLNFLVNTLRLDAGIDFAADRANGCLLIETYNVQGFAHETDRVRPERLDDDWLDRLGRYLLCEGPHPERTQLDEGLRADLRARMEAEQAEREAELARLEEEARRLEAESSRRARVERALRRVFDRVGRRPTDAGDAD
jgi:hypothetical protein